MLQKMAKIMPNPRTHEFTEWVFVGEYYYNARNIIGFGGDLTVENWRNAYGRGIFPWHCRRSAAAVVLPESARFWNSKRLHLPRSLRREWQKTTFTLHDR
jgi:Leu/Phe-tRNA-protein transferase